MLLAVAFGSLVALSVGAVLALSVEVNIRNTRSLLDDRAMSMIDVLEQRIIAQFKQDERVASSLVELHARGYLKEIESPARRAVILALMSAAPDISGIALKFKNGEDIAYFRDQGFMPLPRNLVDSESTPIANERTVGDQAGDGLNSAAEAKAPWQTPILIGSELFLNVATPLGGEGTVYVFVRQDVVSRLIRQIAPPNGAVVFLLSQDDRVISHSGEPELFRRSGFPLLSEFPDAALRDFRTAHEVTRTQELKDKGIGLFATPGLGDGYIYITNQLSGHWSRPLTLGVYFQKADIATELLRVLYVLLSGIAGLLLAVAAAIFLGRKISRPLEQVAQSASLLSEMQFDKITILPRSRIREIDRQTTALNNMYTTVRQFTRYVPRELVERLMRSGETADKPVEREVSVLFTDIAGFTNLSEKMTAGEISRLLNRHFEILTRNISATGGTVDKYMGDGVMAFWGAPANDPDHIVHALTAVKNIIRDVETENAEKRSRGEPVLRLRLGLHTGPVVVGNIGGAVRQNYTIVGDTVNVAQRLEQLAREYMQDDRQAVALVSSAISDAAGSDFSFTPAVKHKIRGREGSVGVSLLDPG